MPLPPIRRRYFFAPSLDLGEVSNRVNSQVRSPPSRRALAVQKSEPLHIGCSGAVLGCFMGTGGWSGAGSSRSGWGREKLRRGNFGRGMVKDPQAWIGGQGVKQWRRSGETVGEGWKEGGDTGVQERQMSAE